MLARYSHISNQAKQAAIEALEAAWAITSDFQGYSPQKSQQLVTEAARPQFAVSEKALNWGILYGAGDRFRSDDLVPWQALPWLYVHLLVGPLESLKMPLRQ